MPLDLSTKLPNSHLWQRGYTRCMAPDPEIVLDDRRRTSFSKIGHKEHRRYLVKELDDGTLVLTPAFTISAPELAVLRDAALSAGLRASPGLRPDELRSRGSFAQHAGD